MNKWQWAQQKKFEQDRRSFLMKSGVGLGSIASMGLLGNESALAQASVDTGILGTGHHTARAKRVIHLHMLGAISCVDTFDYKPVLREMHGQEIPPSVKGDGRVSTMSAGQSAFPIAGSIAEFNQGGQSGAWISDLLPYTREIADELCFIKTMNTEQINHDPAAKFLYTGFQLSGRPTTGAWINYALGSDNSDLPSFVVMNAGDGRGVPQDTGNWGSGFLPSHHQGVEFRAAADPVLYVNNPDGQQREDRRDLLDALGDLAETQFDLSNDPEVLSKISQYEMAFRMQKSVPEVADISDEPDYILDMYGPEVHRPGSHARNCLIARRLCERGVKYINVFQLGWDHHGSIQGALPELCQQVDQPSAALVMDLKQRGLLDDTLVMFGSEFGRTPFIQGDINSPLYGRDHHGSNFTWWFAGAGTKAGYTHGETDDFNYNIVKDPVHIHDLNATIMHILGIDHTRLTYRFQGRDFRLTDAHGEVVHQILT